MEPVAFETRPISIRAEDGYTLAGTLYVPERPRLAALVSSGTGFPRSFYRRFAAAWAARGVLVLTYDYRGIGESAPANLKGSTIEYTQWGRLDMPAALQALSDAAPGLRLVHMAHSVGGHFLGFMPNHALLDRHAFVAVGSGYWAKHHRANIPRELFFWWGLGPFHLATAGYIKGGGLWSGASLPKGVFTTWRRWCMQPGYFEEELKGRLRPHHFDDVRAPIRSWIFTDDGIATPRTGADMLGVYPNAPSEMVVRRPVDYGLDRIGHEGAFRGDREALWSEMWDWLEGDRPAAGA